MTKTQKYTTIPIIAGLLLLGGALGAYGSIATADTDRPAFGSGMRMGPGIHGTIASISGTSITVTGANGTTYTVDASAAQVYVGQTGQQPTVSSVSSLKVGDEIGIHGTVSGTTIAATRIMSGDLPVGARGKGSFGRGNGIHGTVSAVSGSSITVMGDNGTTYTVDASGASISRMATGSLSDITVGDRIGVRGSVSGATVTAENIMDNMPAPLRQ